MNLTPKTKTVDKKGSWIWWLLFPPYAMYRFIRFSPLKWYVKVPTVLVLTLTLIIAIDLAVSPDRVEMAEAKEAIEHYVNEELSGEKVLVTERLELGTSVTAETIQLAVYYRVITDKSLYQVGLVSDKNNNLMIHHVEQLYPMRQDIKGFDSRTKADVAIWLKANEQEVGVPLKLLEDEKSENLQSVLTANGEYEFRYKNTHLYEVSNSKTDKVLFKTEEEPPLPKAIETYLEKNEERVGTLTRVLAYELVDGVERHYLLTSQGNFMTESFPDGRIDINIRNDKKE